MFDDTRHRVVRLHDLVDVARIDERTNIATKCGIVMLQVVGEPAVYWGRRQEHVAPIIEQPGAPAAVDTARLRPSRAA